MTLCRLIVSAFNAMANFSLFHSIHFLELQCEHIPFQKATEFQRNFLTEMTSIHIIILHFHFQFIDCSFAYKKKLKNQCLFMQNVKI